MNPLTVIEESLEEELPEEYSELVHNLSSQLKQALNKIEEYEEKLSKIDLNESRIKELMSLCQSKNSEIFALERKVKELASIAEKKDQQIISMLSLNKEFKQLVESEDKIIQTDQAAHYELESKSVKIEEKHYKARDIAQNEESEKLKLIENQNREAQFLASVKKKNEAKVKPGGYYPLFLRKPKEGFIGSM